MSISPTVSKISFCLRSGEYSGSSGSDDFSGSMSPASFDDSVDQLGAADQNRNEDRSRSPRIVHREFSIESFDIPSDDDIQSEFDAELELVVQHCVREEARQAERASMRRNDFNVGAKFKIIYKLFFKNDLISFFVNFKILKILFF